MEDIIAMISEKAGISETQAKLAAGAIFDRIDDKLPAPIAAQVKKSLGLDTEGMLGSVAGDLGDKAGGLADMAKGLAGDGASGAGDLLGKAGGLFGK